jgi:hypothetical protein
MFAGQIFKTIAGIIGARADTIALFLEGHASFEEWFMWEAFAACRSEGWSVRPRVSYADVGLAGSRETADLLVIDPTSDDRVLVEMAIIHDWTTNRWVASLDLDTMNLTRPLSAGVVPLQIVTCLSLQSPIEVNRQYRSWLEMTRIWARPCGLSRELQMGASGQALVKGWVLTDADPHELDDEEVEELEEAEEE